MEATTTTPTSAETTREAVKRDFEALIRRDADGIKAAYADDAVIEFPAIEHVFRGNEEMRQFFAELFAAVPDLETTYEIVAVDGDTAVIEWRMRGNHTGGQLQGIDATDKEIEMRGCDVMRVENDRIARNTAYYDQMSMVRQIGMMPAIDSGAEKAMKSAFNAATKLRSKLANR